MKTEYIQTAKSFKRAIASSYQLVDGAVIKEKLSGEDFLITKKLDGALTLLFYHDGVLEACKSTGVERSVEYPCMKEFAALCRKAGLQSATVAAELYAVISDTGRERVGDVATAISDPAFHDRLRLAPFAIVDLNGEAYVAEHYKHTLAKLNELFSGTLVQPVEGRSGSKADVLALYDEWVVEGGAEGLVVHSELPIVHKVKPRHSIDAVVIGYALGDAGIRSLMVAAMTPEGRLQEFATVGGGFTDAQRLQMLEQLQQMSCPSEYVETDSRNVAYRMVRPEIVIEMSIIDLVSEDSKGEAKINPLLSYTPEAGYQVEAQTPGVSVYSPTFIRVRDDKTANTTDIRISQLTDLCPFAEQKPVVLTGLPKSELLLRRVFVKGEGPKLMIQKYVVWKTNKEQTGSFPAYVFHYTDFSAGRAEALKRDLRVSASREQIMQIAEEFIAKNVKKGWVERVCPAD